MTIILDYSDFIEEAHRYERNGPMGSIAEKIIAEPDDLKSFYSDRGICPFCKQVMPKAFHASQHFVAGLNDFTSTIVVSECQLCGWWEWVNDNLESSDYLDRVDDWVDNLVRRAVVKRFEASDITAPVSALMNELTDKKRLLREVDPRKLEEIAQYAFSAFYNCRVEHVGRSHDGGVDLVIVHSDESILVQVKRRASQDYTESVSVVREFIGAMYLNNASQGIILSTAKKFSPAARNDARRVVADRKFKRFDLIDFTRFCEVLDVVQNERSKGWQKLVPDLRSSAYSNWSNHLETSV